MNVTHILDLYRLSVNPSYINKTILSFLCFIVINPLSAQKSDYIPKSKFELLRDKTSEKQERQQIISSRIRSVIQSTYPFVFGKPDKKGNIELMTRYNSAGRKIEEIRYNQFDGSEQNRTTYKYDKYGNLIEEIFKKDEKELKINYRYGGGKKLETVHYKADGTVEKKISNVYDDNNLLLETVGYLNDGRSYFRDSYLYSTHGEVIEFKNNLNRYLYTYDDRGNISTIRKYTRYFKSADSMQYLLTNRFEFKHTVKNYLIGLEQYGADSMMKSQFSYLVDAQGNLLEEKEFSGDGKLVFQRSLSYSKNNNLLEETGTDRGRKFRHTYSYDGKGNKTEWIQYDQLNEPLSVTKYFYSKSSVERNPSQTAELSDTTFVDDGEPLTLDEYNEIVGCRIVASDGAYLGSIIADTVNPQSIINFWGQYGYNESPSSIFNSNISYGGNNGEFSPFNTNCPSPPSLYKEGKFYSYFTENKNFRPRVAPRKLITLLKNLVHVSN